MKKMVSIISTIIMIMAYTANVNAQSPDMKGVKTISSKSFVKLEKDVSKIEIQYFNAIRGGVIDSTAEYADFASSPDEAYKAAILAKVNASLKADHKLRSNKLKDNENKKNIIVKFKFKTYVDANETYGQSFNLMEKKIYSRQIILINGEIPEDELNTIAQPIVGKFYQETQKKLNFIKNNEE